MIFKSNNEHRMAKGTICLMIAQAIYLGSGYIIHFGLARVISPIEYGRFGVILSILMITQIFLNTGIPETVSKFISEGKDTKTVKMKSLQLQFIFSIIFFLGVFLSAPLIADLLNDSRLVDYIRFASFIIPVRAILATYRGVLNGLRNFGKTASVNIINAVFRIVFVFVLIFIGFELYGAIGGYILGAFAALWFAIIFSRGNRDGKKVFSREMVTFSLPMIGFAVSYTAVMNLDMLFVKSLLGNQNIVGYYTAARALTSIVFGIIFVLSLTLLPSISKSYAEKNIVQTKSYINDSMRYLLMILLPTGVLISLTSRSILGLFFPRDYVEAGNALSVLIIGIILISIFVVLGSIINGIGKPRISFTIGMFLFISSLFLNYFMVNLYGIVGAAYVILIVGFIGVLIFSILVYKKFHTIISAKSSLKIICSSIVIGVFLKIIENFYVIEGLVLIPIFLLLLILYFLILWLVKEIGPNEISYIKSIFVKKS